MSQGRIEKVLKLEEATHSQKHSYTSCFHKITTIVMPRNPYMINQTSNPS